MKKIDRFERDSYIALVDPIQDWTTWKTCAHSLIEPLGIEIIGAVLKNNGYKIKIFQAQGKKLIELAAEIEKFKPRIVGLTSYTYNFEDAIKLAKILKKQDRNIITLFGGYHSTFVPEIVKDQAVDFVIKGPGEIATLELVKALERGADLRNVSSIAYLDHNKKNVIQTYQNKILFDLDEMPFAIRDEEILEGCSINSMMYPPRSQQKRTAAIYASRGCPYSCSYCTSPAFYHRCIRFRSPSDVVSEIEILHSDYDVNILFFTDLTFNLDRKYVIELCELMIKKKMKIFWYALFRPEGVDKDLVKILKRAGCSKVAIGIESTDISTLRKVGRGGIRLYLENLKETCKNLHREEILTRGLVIVGYPWETRETYKRLDEYLSSILLDEIRIGILTPFPGTNIFHKYNNIKKLITNKMRYYDSRHVIIKPEYLEPKDILKNVKYFYEKYKGRV